MVKKYVLRPGVIYSKNDDDPHHIDAPTLARLYGVLMSECIVIHQNEKRISQFGDLSKMISLYPDYHGNYKLPPRDEQGSGRKDGKT